MLVCEQSSPAARRSLSPVVKSRHLSGLLCCISFGACWVPQLSLPSCAASPHRKLVAGCPAAPWCCIALTLVGEDVCTCVRRFTACSLEVMISCVGLRLCDGRSRMLAA